jgi:hypothetical protein
MFTKFPTGLMLVALMVLVACDSTGSAALPRGQSKGAAQAEAPESLDFIRSDIRDEASSRDDTRSIPPSYKVGIATAAAVRERRVTECEDKPTSERAACRNEANTQWELHKGEIEPSRSSTE